MDAGRNPDASWWVGMIAKYKYPETGKLQSRINQCFQRSMNGLELHDAATMHAIIDYMKWLDEEYASKSAKPPANGYPKVPLLAGNSVRGNELFVHKCAVCHGPNGEGRYGGDAYYRPALWGKQSFNARAGLSAKPEKMAAFLKSNMPFGSGGALTNQDAWDLTAFLALKPRPEKGQ